jgi:hypothetical protein
MVKDDLTKDVQMINTNAAAARWNTIPIPHVLRFHHHTDDSRSPTRHLTVDHGAHEHY